MKIGILTQPLHVNYGGLLQNYALQQTLIQAGYDVETIDWRWLTTLRDNLFLIKRSLLAILLPDKYKAPRYIPTKKEQDIIRKNTNHFIHKYIHHTNAMSCLDDFKKQAEKGKYDVYIVGSDQCWRPKYNSFLPAMFLSFIKDKNVKRIAYAASFGTDYWEMTPDMTIQCASLAQKFDLTTVREDSGIMLCKEYFGIDAYHVLDPTMLLTKEDYIHLIKAENEPQLDGALFNYILDPESSKSTFINKVAESMKLKPFQILPKHQEETRTKKDVKEDIENCVFPCVTTWIRAFMDAEMTIVDSYHGMIFSILFNKPFWVIGNADRGMSRFTSLLNIFNLEDRLIDVNKLDNFDITRPINWDRINNILELKRNESKNYLLNSLR